MGDIGGDRLREIFRAFPTGITIVTSRDEDGTPYGLTCNAVTAVSLRPALLLVCLDEHARTLGAILRSDAFAVNFLAEGGAGLAEVFAGKADDKFAGLSWEPGPSGAPVLTEWITAYAGCRLVQETVAGDHSILVGQVTRGGAYGRSPLLHRPGEYMSSGRAPT